MKPSVQSKSSRIVAWLAAIFIVTRAFAGDESLPRVFYADPAAMADAKAKLSAGDPSLKPALDHLVDEANKALEMKPTTVMEKQHFPPSGDKHDFISQAPYFWRDTNHAGKYLRRDGERNPEARVDSDANRLGSICSTVHTLGLAYYFTGNEKYAAKAAELLRVFFLDADTKMNPNLNYGQGIPGVVDGRPAGLISARGFIPMVDGLGLLEKSKSWSPEEQEEMHDWMKDYFHWLTTSKIGTGELGAKNNHGTFCDAQAAAIALFIGETNYARDLISEARTNRVSRQIEPDGKQPFELARTLSFGYSSFNLQGLCDLASLGQNIGVDLWHYQSPRGGSIYQAMLMMAKYADPKAKWPYQQIHDASRDGLASLILRATPQFPETGLAGSLQYFKASQLATDRSRLMFRTAEFTNAPAKHDAHDVDDSLED